MYKNDIGSSRLGLMLLFNATYKLLPGDPIHIKICPNFHFSNGSIQEYTNLIKSNNQQIILFANKKYLPPPLLRSPSLSATRSVSDEGGIDNILKQENYFLSIFLSKSVK